MCLSPEVDVVASITIGTFAIDALRHNKGVQTLPIALVPAIFAVHTFASAVVWWGNRGNVPSHWGNLAAQFFIAIAFVLLPIYIPLAVLCLEPVHWRRFIMTLFSAGGLIAGAMYAHHIALGDSSAVVCKRYVDYHVSGVSLSFAILYDLATLGAVLVSSYRSLQLWGMINILAIGVLSLVEREGLPSLWCFWAACTSGCIAWAFRSGAFGQKDRLDQVPSTPPVVDSG